METTMIVEEVVATAMARMNALDVAILAEEEDHTERVAEYVRV